MRPTPKAKHLIAILIFAVVSAASGYLAFLDDRMSPEQIQIATVAMKRMDQQGLFPNDPVYGSEGRWRFHAPLNQAMMEMLLWPTKYNDPALPFRAGAGILVMIYLCGMYTLLYQQCGSWSVSAYVSVLSTAVVYAFGESFWGVGSLGSILPATLVTAITPLIALTYLHYENRDQILILFAFVGFCANISPPTAMNLTLVLVLVYLLRHRFAPKAVAMALLGGLCALGTALPYLGYYWHLRSSLTPPDAEISAAAVDQAFRLGDWAVLYPDILKSLLYWLLQSLGLLIPTTVLILRVERFRIRNLGFWLSWAAAALFIALGLHGLSQWIGLWRDDAPWVIDFAGGACFVMLPLYVLFAQSLTNLFRLLHTHKTVLRWACIALMAAWLLPTDNLRVGRHYFYKWTTAFMEDDQKPLRVLELRDRRQERTELASLAAWARENTPPDAMFITDRAEFRMLSRRPVAVCRDDVKYYYYVTPWKMDEWIEWILQQKKLLQSPSEAAVDEFIATLRKGGFPETSQWYIVLSAENPPQIRAGLTPVESPRWGDQYLLYRIH